MRSGRSIAVHRAAKDAAQVPMLLYGSGETYWSLLLFSQPEESEEGEFPLIRFIPYFIGTEISGTVIR